MKPPTQKEYDAEIGIKTKKEAKHKKKLKGNIERRSPELAGHSSMTMLDLDEFCQGG